MNEPSIVAFDRSSKHIIAIGREAQAMVGKTHKDIKIIRPLRDGAIADFEITEGMLRAFIRKVSLSWQPARRVVVCVPSGLTEVEKTRCKGQLRTCRCQRSTPDCGTYGGCYRYRAERA